MWIDKGQSRAACDLQMGTVRRTAASIVPVQARHIGREPSHSIRHATVRLTNTIHIVHAKKEISLGLGVLEWLKPWNWAAHQHQVGLDALLSRIGSHSCACLHGLLLLNQLVWESATPVCSHPGNLPWHHYDSCLLGLGLGLPVQLLNFPVLGIALLRAHSFLSTISPPLAAATAAAIAANS